MKVTFTTPVPGNVRQVFAGFNRNLFQALKPPFMTMELTRFDGTQLGSWVEVRTGMGKLLSSKWSNLVVERADSDIESYFIDEGRTLPFPFKQWRHKHRVIHERGYVLIVDELNYRTRFWILDLIMWPVMLLFLVIRNPVYKKYFGKYSG